MNDTIDIARVTGRIAIDERDIYDPDLDVVELRARVGMVFQKPNPFPKSIFENIAYGPRIHGLARSKTDFDEIVEGSLRRAGLFEEVKDRLQEPGTGLSGGQQQRLCIARAIAVNPDVILMDEPCSALDPIATARVEELIDELRTKLHHRHGDTFHAAGGPRLAEDGLLPSRLSRRGRADRGDFHEPPREADGRITLRAVSAEPHNDLQENPNMVDHTVSSFDDELQALRSAIMEMGGIAEKMLLDSTTALVRRDVNQAQAVVAMDDRLDDLQRQIEERAILHHRRNVSPWRWICAR